MNRFAYQKGLAAFPKTQNTQRQHAGLSDPPGFMPRAFPENPYLEYSQTTLPMARIVRFLTRRGARLPVLACLMVFPLCLAGQDTGREAAFMTCLKQTYQDSGEALDILMNGFEAELIAQGLLESRNSEDYRGLLQRLASGQRIERTGYLRFSDRYQNITPDSDALQDCRAGLENFKATNPETTLTRFLDRREAMIRESIPADLQAAALLDILGETELDEPFYRLHTYYLVDLQALPPADTGLEAATPFAGYQVVPEPGANIMRLYLNERNQILFSDRLITPEQLSEQVLRHARQFGTQAWYIIEPEPDVKFSSLQALQDQIARAVSSVRDQYARSVLGKTWTEMNTEERALVAEKFPLRITLP